ncbi:NUDIX domain-containing protein [Actinoplanes friuliensis]|uniref:NUDIX hydrolase n=1 Tax=Actinoplanes friuliensis DSM 7358 TaxID=1246995 RepID=U5W654_9ACTN|nr:NUDIX hydrolase [Actinoplanes friuliensis]AGZ43431.1 NUDIX hydrolase [Actinoplanes friuliensis DSM 7358]
MKQVSTRVVYSNPWMTVREDQIAHPDGTPGIYGVVEKRDFALVLPRWEDGFWLVEQFRYPIGRRAWEFPQGGWGHSATGTSAELARTELAEETGLRARSLVHLGHLYEAYGYSTQGFDVYLAEDLTEGDTAREQSEQDMVHRRFTDAEIAEALRSGRIVDAPSLAALTLYGLHTG